MAEVASNNSRTIRFTMSAKVIAQLLRSDSMDCCFEIRDEATNGAKTFSAHRKLLSALSPVFAAMFNGAWNENSNAIVIVDATPEAFGQFLDFFYKGEIVLDTNNFNELFYLAHKYDVDDLFRHCAEFAVEHVSIENVLHFYNMAIRFEQYSLKSKCVEFITVNTENVLKSVEFYRCDKETLQNILEITKFSCKESVIFDFCIKWAKHKCRIKQVDELCQENLQIELGDCFKLIRFKEMPRDEFKKLFQLFKAMFSKNETDDILIELLQNTPCPTNTRYVDLAKAVHRQMVDSVFQFKYAGQKFDTSDISTQIEFKLTKSAMLESITFSQPFLFGIKRYLQFNVSIEIERQNIKVFQCYLKTSDEEYACFRLPKLVFIEGNQPFTLKMHIIRGNSGSHFNVWLRSHYVSEDESYGILLEPIDNIANANPNHFEIDRCKTTFISALHFQHCNDANIEEVFGEYLKFNES